MTTERDEGMLSEGEPISDPENSLTYWIQRKNSPDQAIRGEAARRITEAFDTQLRHLIEAGLARRLRGKVGASDLVQSAFASLFRGSNDFPSRNALFAYLKETALHKLENLRKYYGRQVRDVKREVLQGARQSDESDSCPDILEQGRKFVPTERNAKRAYRQDVHPDPTQVGSDDSFFTDGPVHLMVHGASPAAAALVLDMVSSLGDYDEVEHDCLQQIALLLLEGLGPGEIATRLGMAKKTAERKRGYLAELLHLGRSATIATGEQADASSGIPLNVLPTDSAKSLLQRAGVEGCRLCLDTPGKPLRHFSASDRIYPHVAEGATLRAIPES